MGRDTGTAGRSPLADGLASLREDLLAGIGSRGDGLAGDEDGVGDGAVDVGAARLAVVEELERLKHACSAAQARVTAAFADAQVARLVAGGSEEGLARRSVGSQVALARRESPSRGDRLVGLARALVHELPATLASMTAGDTSEWRATLVAQGTATLSRADRVEVDRRLAADLPTLGDRALAAAVRRLACELDAASVVARMRRAVASRRVSVRPAADGMGYLTVLGPLAECVGAFASLDRAAQAVVGGYADSGEQPQGRSRGQVMADLALRLLSGRSATQPHPVELGLVMTDTALFGYDRAGEGDPARTSDHTECGEHAPSRGNGQRGGGGPAEPRDHAQPRDEPDAGSGDHARTRRQGAAGRAREHGAADGPVRSGTSRRVGASTQEPALLSGPGMTPVPVPAAFARALVRDEQAAVWLRRLYTSPDGRDLVGLDSRRRLFTGALRKLLVLRDQACRTPWCGAPIRDLDHATPHRAGGATDTAEGNGTCQRCDLTKEAPGWRHRPVGRPREGPDPGPHELEVTTPTGTVHRSTAPPLLGWGWHSPDQPSTDAEQATSSGIQVTLTSDTDVTLTQDVAVTADAAERDRVAAGTGEIDRLSLEAVEATLRRMLDSDEDDPWTGDGDVRIDDDLVTVDDELWTEAIELALAG